MRTSGPWRRPPKSRPSGSTKKNRRWSVTPCRSSWSSFGCWSPRPFTGAIASRVTCTTRRLPVPVAPDPLVERDRARRGDVQRLRGTWRRDSRRRVAAGQRLLREAVALRAEDEDGAIPHVQLDQRLAAVRDQADPQPPRLVEAAERDTEDRAGGRPQRLRAGRGGAARREPDRGAERVGGPDQRPDVPRVGDALERERHRPRLERGQVVAPEHAHHTRRMRQGRDRREQLAVDRLARDEQLDRIEPGAE